MLREAFDVAFSSVYRTAARDVEDQDDFLNAVAKIETEKSPEQMIEVFESIESTLKKDPPFEKGPRTIDIDILLSSKDEIRNTKYEIPHPRLHERRFVLEPLCELIDPESKHPTLNASYESFLKKTLDQDCEKLDIVL